MPQATPQASSRPSTPSSSVKSILRNPSILGRRKTDDEPSSSDPSSTKRRKVLFEVGPTIHDISQGDAKREVTRVLDEHRRGEDEGYMRLKEMFENAKPSMVSRSPDADESQDDSVERPEMRDYIIALTNCAQLLKHKEYSDLTKHILDMAWVGRDESFVKAYIQFLAALVSSQGSYLTRVLTMIVNKFRDSRPADWKVPDCPEVDRGEMRSRLHTSLQYLMQMFPAAKPVLRNTIVNKLPYSDESVRAHMAYMDNLLRLRDYAEDMAEDILDMILSHLIKIDVQMQLDLEDMDDEISSSVVYLLQNTETPASWEDAGDDDEDSDAESVDSDDSAYDAKAEKIKTIKCSVEKLDAMLDTLFMLYSGQFNEPDSDDGIRNFTILARQFTDIILPSLKSRHTQFLLFHVSQLSEQLMDAFCSTCMAIAFQTNRPNIVRHAAAAYLASFVARGSHLPSDMVRTVFRVLLHHMDCLRETHEPQCRGPDIKKYQTYYALCQAALYIFCFRWRDLVVSNDDEVDPEDLSSYVGQDLQWLPNLRDILKRNVYSTLNPMKVCAPSIVEEFAKMAHRLNLMYIYPLLASNKRVRLSQFVSDTYANGGALRDVGEMEQGESYYQLEPYFPFDPYQLPVSKRWVEQDYLQWQKIPGLNVDEDEETVGNGNDHDSSDNDDE